MPQARQCKSALGFRKRDFGLAKMTLILHRAVINVDMGDFGRPFSVKH
jgi:hypothetical protein